MDVDIQDEEPKKDMETDKEDDDDEMDDDNAIGRWFNTKCLQHADYA